MSYNGTEQPRFTIKDDLTFTRRSHTIKAGFTYDRQQANGFGQQDIGGRARFSFLQTGVPGVTNFANAGGSSFASFLLGYANEGRTETIRYLQQVYPYYGFYAQDDWRLNNKLVINYGVRYEFTVPPVAGGDQYSELDPTKPNPSVNNYPGALMFAGDGEGREGKRSLIPGYYGAWAPRVSGAYSLNDKTTLRAGIGRSFGRVTVISGTSHFAGFIGQYEFFNSDSGVTPTFLLDRGLPAYPLPPQINPSFSNNTNVDYWNGKEAMLPATYDSWTVSVQRELRPRMTLEVDYNGSKGSNLQANLLNLNQVPLSVAKDLIARFGAAGAVSLLNSQITSAAAVAAGITPPYPNFTNPAVQTNRSVAQSLRPFPQYATINTTNSGGDKTGRSMYHAGVLKLTQQLSQGFMFQGSYTYSRLMTDADTFSGSTGSMDTAQPELEYSIGRFDQPHSIKLSTVYELPVRAGTALAERRRPRTCPWRLATRRHPDLRQRAADRRDDERRTPADFQRDQSSEHDRRRLARADRGRRIRSARRSVSGSGGLRPAGGRARQRAQDERRRAPAVEPDREPERGENGVRLEQAAPRRPRGSVQSLQPGGLGRPGTELQQRQLRADYVAGEFAATDAVRREAVLVGDDFSAGAATARRAGRSISLMTMTAGLGAASTASHSRMSPRSPARVSVVVSAAHVTA